MDRTSFEIIRIKELSYNYKTLNAHDIVNLSKEKILIKFGLRFEVGEQPDIFVVYPNITYEYKKDEKAVEEILNIESQFFFRIGDLPEIFKPNRNNFELPEEIMEAVVSIAFSAIRGMVAVKTAGNFLSEYPLPVFDVRFILDHLRATATARKKATDSRERTLAAQRKTKPIKKLKSSK